MKGDGGALERPNVFWVPRPARCEKLRAATTEPEIGKIVNNAMITIKHENPSLRDVLNKEYARPDLDQQNLGRTHEYFLSRFASAGGQLDHG